MATSTALANFQRDKLAMDTLSKNSLDDLVLRGKCGKSFDFGKLVTDIANRETSVGHISTKSFYNLREARLGEFEWTALINALNYTERYCMSTADKLRQQPTNDPNHQQRNTNHANRLTKSAADLYYITQDLPNVRQIHSDKSIIKNLELTFRQGWTNGTMRLIWTSKELCKFDKYKVASMIKGLVNNNAPKAPRSRQPTNPPNRPKKSIAFTKLDMTSYLTKGN